MQTFKSFILVALTVKINRTENVTYQAFMLKALRVCYKKLSRKFFKNNFLSKPVNGYRMNQSM